MFKDQHHFLKQEGSEQSHKSVTLWLFQATDLCIGFARWTLVYDFFFRVAHEPFQNLAPMVEDGLCVGIM